LFDYFINYDSSCQNWLEGYWKILEFFSVRQYNYPTIATNPRMGASFLHNLIGAATQQDPIYVGVQASVWHMHAWKAWPTQKMTELCLRLISDERIYVVIFGQPGQDELCKSIKAQCSQNVRVINAVGKLSIAQLPDAVAACSVVVSNDSGLMHLAAAVGTPTVAIYGMTDQEVSWVYGDATHSTLVRRAKTNPCYHKVRNITKYCVSKECINNISVDLVFTATTEILYGK
jgi:ADP-heptose:LPS heptosyltransferase